MDLCYVRRCHADTDVRNETGQGDLCACKIGTYVDDVFDLGLVGAHKVAGLQGAVLGLPLYEGIDVMQPNSEAIVLDARFDELIRVKPRGHQRGVHLEQEPLLRQPCQAPAPIDTALRHAALQNADTDVETILAL